MTQEAFPLPKEGVGLNLFNPENDLIPLTPFFYKLRNEGWWVLQIRIHTEYSLAASQLIGG